MARDQSDGYRVNNALDQRSGFGDLRYTTPDFSAYLIYPVRSASEVAGPRTVDPSLGNQSAHHRPKRHHTPFDYGNSQNANATGGFTKTLWNGVDLIVDGGYRNKQQQSAFLGAPAVTPSSFPSSRVSATWSPLPD